MKISLKISILVVTVFLLSNQITFSQLKKKQTKKPTTPEQVINKYYKAIGGKEKHKKISNKLMKFSGKMVTEVSGKTTKMTTKNIMAFNKESKYLTLIGDTDGLTTKIYYDGNDGYTYLKAFNTKTPFDSSLNKLYKDQSKRMLQGIDADGEYLPKVKLDSIKNKAYYVITHISEVNNEVYRSKMYFDTKTDLLYANFSKGSGVSTETYFLDYRDINGYTTAMHNVIVSDLGDGNKSVISNVYEEFSYNGYLDSYFTDDISVSEQQLNAVIVSHNRHEKGLSSLGLSSYSTSRKDIADNTTTAYKSGTNLRDVAYKEILDKKKQVSTSSSTGNTQTIESSGERTRVKYMQEEYKNFTDLKYRRSSLYTLMVNDDNRERNTIIKNAFGNTELSTKFNDHNIGPYLINGIEGDEEQMVKIETYLNEKGVAKELVAKWFNRDADGNFNMDLIAERGQYNASDLNVQIAKSSKRGAAILKDAGEELIGNTFVIVYDYKYTNKEETAKKRGGFLKALSSIASIAGADDIATIADGAKLASDVMGKGYFVRTTSYLYRLVWNDEVANTFYTEMWVDKDNTDANKKEAFDKTNLFKLKYVGSEISRTNLQSTVFTQKDNNQLIEIATTKAVDKNIGKLQRKFEEFRVKTPLLSGDPLAAKIGTKEGIEKGDKFEVLEQLMDEDGFTTYKRVGTIKVDPKQIWNNAFLANEENTDVNEPSKEKKSKKKGMFASFSNTKKSDTENDAVEKPEFTIFKGKKGKFASGMLIRQIN